MSKKKEKKEIEVKPFAITAAAIKDDFCDYSFEILQGVGLGDTHSVKGKGIIDGDLKDAMASLNVHLAAIDDVFKHAGVDIDNIDKFTGHQLACLYHVSGFKIKGNGDNEAIILIGTKFVSCSGERMDLETPRIPLDNLSSYTWHNELKTAADNARREVELYKGGKCTAVEEEQIGTNQHTIGESIGEEEFRSAGA